MTIDTLEKAPAIDLKSKIEEICESIVLSEPSDFQAISSLYNRFEAINQWTLKSDNHQLAPVIQSVQVILENILLEQCENPEESLAVVSATVLELQSVYRDGNHLEEAHFPDELHLNAASPTESNISISLQNLPAHVDEEIFTEFLSQQDGAMSEMETIILSIENSNESVAADELLRMLHTLKGESALMGLSDVEQLCHRTEDYIKLVNSEPAVDVLLSVKDWLQVKFNSFSGGEQVTPLEIVVASLQVSGNGSNGKTATAPEEATNQEIPEVVQPEPPGESQTWEIDTDLCADFVVEGKDHLDESDAQLLMLESNPDDPDALDTVFRAFHTIKGVAGFLDLKEIGLLAHKAENLLDQARKGRMALKGAAMDITFESVDFLKQLIGVVAESLSSGLAPAPTPGLPDLLERITAVGNLDDDNSRSSSETEEKEADNDSIVKPDPKPIEETETSINTSEPLATTSPENVVFTANKPSIQQSGQAQTTKLKEILKVDAQRLDQLVDAIGELVIAESMVSQSEELVSTASPTLVKHLSQLDKITRELQSMGTSLRMVTVRSVFQKMARLVRDLSKKSGKEIEFVMVGAETEVDKSVVDKIGDPLIHMIRNAVDHGIESDAQTREASGKPRKGRVELRAFQKGGNIYIEVEDDGQGLNRDVILAKSIEKGLIKKDQKLTDSEIWNLVLEPGFSTAKKVTEISGRGVGMDVVKRNIESLRGLIDIQSKQGSGSLFSIRLPLTLAIIDGMIVQVGNSRYIVPTLSVKESLQPDRKALSTVLNQGEMLDFHDHLIPIIRLDQQFQIKGAKQDPSDALIVVIEADGKEAGLLVDALLGQQQVVIKSLGETMNDIQGLSGCTIMPDGRVGLILDASGLLKR